MPFKERRWNQNLANAALKSLKGMIEEVSASL
jgi:hypothetical protein